MLIGKPPSIVEVKDDGTGTFFAHLDDVRGAGATEARNALIRAAGDWGEERGLAVSDVDYSLFDDEYSPATAIGFSAGTAGLTMDLGFFLDDFDDEAATEADVRRTVEPLLRRRHWTFLRAEMDPNYAASPWLWHLRVKPPTRGRTLGELYAVAEEMLAVVEATTGAGLRRETVLELLRAGRAEVLIGQPEGDWLDVKSQDYDLSTDSGKISLAQDVARFANGEYGGIVVVGTVPRSPAMARSSRMFAPFLATRGASDAIARRSTIGSSLRRTASRSRRSSSALVASSSCTCLRSPRS